MPPRPVGVSRVLDFGSMAPYLRYRGNALERCMLEALKSLIAGLENHGNRRSDFDDDDYQVAAAALLVHAAALDGDLTTEGRDKLRTLLKKRFALDDGDADKLISRAEAAEHDAVDIYHFTRLLNRSLDED